MLISVFISHNTRPAENDEAQKQFNIYVHHISTSMMEYTTLIILNILITLILSDEN